MTSVEGIAWMVVGLALVLLSLLAAYMAAARRLTRRPSVATDPHTAESPGIYYRWPR